jgi:16S rRNA A1518/A1519 N6-dimethyltransferase RsmA/KsgA/DIM1 with predicted DNA glycosylase/AP lyase activity
MNSIDKNCFLPTPHKTSKITIINKEPQNNYFCTRLSDVMQIFELKTQFYYKLLINSRYSYK